MRIGAPTEGTRALVEQNDTFSLDMIDVCGGRGAYCENPAAGAAGYSGGHRDGGDSEAIGCPCGQPRNTGYRTKRRKSRFPAAAAIPARAHARDWRGARTAENSESLPEPATAADADWRGGGSHSGNARDEEYQLDGDLFSRAARDRAGHGD